MIHFDMTPRKLYNFLIDPDLAEKLKALKASDGVPESEQIRRALREFFARQDAELALLEKRSLAAVQTIKRALASGATADDFKAARQAQKDVDAYIAARNQRLAAEREAVRSVRIMEGLTGREKPEVEAAPRRVSPRRKA